MSISKDTLYGSLPPHVSFDLKRHNLKSLGKPVRDAISSHLTECLTGRSDVEKIRFNLSQKALLLDTAPRLVKKRRSKKRTARKLSRRSIKELNLYSIPRAMQRYTDFVPLHNLWKIYLESMFRPKPDLNTEKAGERLLRLDFHGAIIRVANSLCQSYVGIEGIVVKETKNTFQLVTREDKLKTIPKEKSIFSFDFSGYRLLLAGDNLIASPGVRTSKKTKHYHVAELLINSS